MVTAAPVEGVWIAPGDVKPAKGFESWHEKLFEIGADGGREACIAALEGALVKLSITKDIKLTPDNPLVFLLQPSGNLSSPREAAFRVEKAVTLTPAAAQKVVFLLRFTTGFAQPVFLVEGKQPPEVIIGTLAE